MMTDFATTLPYRRRSDSVLSQLMQFAAVARSRRALAQLDDAALSDIGVTREEAQSEAARPAWDAPARWRR